jgi:hypothetical protein
VAELGSKGEAEDGWTHTHTHTHTRGHEGRAEIGMWNGAGISHQKLKETRNGFYPRTSRKRFRLLLSGL